MTPVGAAVDALAAGLRGYLEAHHVLTLATVDAGGPWATPLFYASDPRLDLFFLSDPATRHGMAIARNSRVSAAVHGSARAWSEVTGLQLRGEARLIAEAGELERALAIYAAKFPFALALRHPDGRHRLYRIRPRRLRLIDNTLRLGDRRELWLDADEEGEEAGP